MRGTSNEILASLETEVSHSEAENCHEKNNCESFHVFNDFDDKSNERSCLFEQSEVRDSSEPGQNINDSQKIIKEVRFIFCFILN